MAYAFGLDAVGDYAGWTKYLATDGGAKTINLLNLDIPAAGIFEAIIQSVAEANGAKLGKVVSLPLNASDATSQVAATAEGDPDVIMTTTSAQLCVPSSQAHVLSHGNLVLAAPAAGLRDDLSFVQASYLGEADLAPSTGGIDR